MSVNISIRDAVKRYSSNTVIRDLTLEIRGGEGYRTFPVEIYSQYLGENGTDHNFAAAISVIAIVVTAVVFFIQKWATKRYSFSISALHPVLKRKPKGLGGFLMYLYCYGLTALAEGVSGPLVLYSSMTDNNIDNLIEAFNEVYPDVEVEVVNGSAGKLAARIRAEKDNPQGDLQWGGLSPADGDVNNDIFAVFGYDTDEACAYLRGLLENGLVISTTSSVCFKAVDSGEYVVGLTYEDGADTLLKAGSTNIRMQYPTNGASATSMGCPMIEGCPHPEAAKAMIDFLMSPEGQADLANRLQTLRFTNPKAEYEIAWLPADSEITWVDRDVAWLTEHKAELLEKWNALYAEIHK